MNAEFDPDTYGDAFAAILGKAPDMALDAGSANRSMRSALSELTIESAFAGRSVDDADSAACCLAGAWLRHGFLDEAHQLCQDVPTASGSYWHGVMHRREGDYGNADYWFRRAGDHPAGAEIASAAASHPETVEAALGGCWDPHRFNEQVQAAVRRGGPLADACQAVQLAEWRALFDFCWRRAVGG